MKTKSYIQIAFLSLLSVIAISCKNGKGSLGEASSSFVEVYVVMDNNEWKNQMLGEALHDVLKAPMKALPQPESALKIFQVNPELFSSRASFKMARNIIRIDIDSTHSQSGLSIEKDRYGYNQYIFTLYAPNKKEMINYLSSNGEKLRQTIINSEFLRIAQWLKTAKGSFKYLPEIKKVFGIDINFIPGLTQHKWDTNFFWATNDDPVKRKDIVIYRFPFTSEKQLSKDSLIAKRNEILGKEIKGAFKSQMATEPKYNPVYSDVKYNGIDRKQLAGLWMMTTDAMGGPFVSQAFLDKEKKNVIVVEVFVYAPGKRKGIMLEIMEGAFYTISFAN